jgi:hypothetical protein
MNYELCKKLKDAGFPQNYVDSGFSYLIGRNDLKFPRNISGAFVNLEEFNKGGVINFEEKIITEPTLSELIEALREKNSNLRMELKDNRWFVQCGEAKVIGMNTIENIEDLKFHLAQLWLNINK